MHAFSALASIFKELKYKQGKLFKNASQCRKRTCKWQSDLEPYVKDLLKPSIWKNVEWLLIGLMLRQFLSQVNKCKKREKKGIILKNTFYNRWKKIYLFIRNIIWICFYYERNKNLFLQSSLTINKRKHSFWNDSFIAVLQYTKSGFCYFCFKWRGNLKCISLNELKVFNTTDAILYRITIWPFLKLLAKKEIIVLFGMLKNFQPLESCFVHFLNNI